MKVGIILPAETAKIVKTNLIEKKNTKNVVRDKVQNLIVDLSRNWTNSHTDLAAYPSDLANSILFCISEEKLLDK